MLLKVKLLTGREIEIDVEPTFTVAEAKKRVEAKSAIPPAQQRLIFAGKAMSVIEFRDHLYLDKVKARRQEVVRVQA